MPLLEDVIDSVFKTLDDNYRSEHSLTLLAILHNIVVVCSKIGGSEESSKKRQSLLLQILEKVQHHTASSKSREARILVLDTIQTGIPAVASMDDGPLLPLIHTLWQPLLKRVSDQDKVITMKIFDVIAVMAKFGREFLAGKFTNELWPYIRRFLQEESANRITTSDLKFSSTFKFQRAILQFLTHLNVHISVAGSTVLEQVQLCKLYLSQNQPHELQEAAVHLFETLIHLDGDVVWYSLHELRGSTFTSSHPSLKPISFASILNSNDYRTNVDKLLHFLQVTPQEIE